MKLQTLLIAAFLAFAGGLYAQERSFSYQGMLLDAAKQPVSGDHQITVTLYDSPTGGEALHSESFATPIVNGVFSVVVGSQTELKKSVKFDKQYWLGISVDGGAEMTPRTALTSVPYATHADAASSLTKGASGAVTSLNGATGDLEFKGGPGTLVETEGKTITITSMHVGGQDPQVNDWHETGGNATGAGSYLGTSNNNALTLAVKNVGTTTTLNNALQLNNNWSVQRDANGNARGNYAVDLQSDRNANSQVANGDHAVIGGGARNTASNNFSTVGGGYINTASNSVSTVSGGYLNTASGYGSIVSGGYTNTASDPYSTVGGGYSNTASNYNSTVGGGYLDSASGYYSTVGGGARNTANGEGSTVGGGSANNASMTYSTVGGGYENTASGTASIVSGGYGNTASGYISTIGGGYENTASYSYSTVGGGSWNSASNSYSTIGGGILDTASGPYSTVGGGYRNTASTFYSTVAGGYRNTANGDYSAIPGGRELILGASADRSFGFNANNAAGTADMSIDTANTAVFGNANLWLANTDNTAHELRFYEAQSSVGDFPAAGTNYTAFKAQAQTANITYTLPSGDGTNGQMLATNGAGMLSWTSDNAGPIDWHQEGGNSAGESSFVGTNNNTVLRLQVKDDETINNSVILNANWSLQRDADGDPRGTNAVDLQNTRSDNSQVASGGHAVIAGGESNTASGDHASVSGGFENTASDYYNVVGGGYRNVAMGGDASTVSGGYENTASAALSTIGGGYGNTASYDVSTIGGGWENTASAGLSTVGGGAVNNASGDVSTVGGGWGNTAGSIYATVAGGHGNNASGDNAAISGGAFNTATSGSTTIAGGQSNTAAYGDGATVGGGTNNYATGNYSTIAGGAYNATTDGPADQGGQGLGYGTVGGGYYNLVVGPYGTIGGGYANYIGYFGADNTPYSTIGGGIGNAVIGGLSCIPGGSHMMLDGLARQSFGFNAGGDPENPEAFTSMRISAPKTAVFGNVDLWLANTDGTAHELRFYEAQAHSHDPAFPASGTNYTAFKAQAQSSNITYTLPAADGASGQMLTTNGTGILSWTAVASGPTDWHETGGNTGGASSFVGTNNNTVLRLQVKNGTTINNSLILNANGSLQRDEAGNARGTNAVDMQQSRSAATQVASGSVSTINGGEINTASGTWSTVGGGRENAATGLASTIGGGNLNTISSTSATVAGGVDNIIFGDLAVIAGGGSNRAHGQGGAIGGGFNNFNFADYAAIPGGRSLTLSSNADNSFGFNANNAAGTSSMSISTPNTAVFGNVHLWLANTDGTARELRFYEAQASAGDFPASGTNYTAFKAQAQSSNITYTLPATVPTTNGALVSTSSGTLSWGSHGRISASAATTQTINDAAVTASNTIIVTIEGTVTTVAITARNAGTSFTITTGAALTTSDVVNYQILP